MTSAKFWDFFTPSPPWHVQKSASFVPFVCFLGIPLPPVPVRTSYMEAQKGACARAFSQSFHQDRRRDIRRRQKATRRLIDLPPPFFEASGAFCAPLWIFHPFLQHFLTLTRENRACNSTANEVQLILHQIIVNQLSLSSQSCGNSLNSLKGEAATKMLLPLQPEI